MDTRKMVVYRNKIVINNYSINDIPALEDLFDVYNSVSHSYKMVGAVYDTKNKVLTIPRGIDIPMIERIAGIRAFYDNSYNMPKSNDNSILIKYPPKDEKQALALKFLTGKDEYSYTKKYNQLFLALNTGAGKTYLGIVYTALLNKKTIIIASNTGWLEQWKNAFLEHTNIVSTEIKHITASSMERVGKKADPTTKVYMITHDSLMSFINTHGADGLNEWFKCIGIGLKIFDEAHLNFESIYTIDYAAPIYKTLYLSATPCRGDSNENRIYQNYFKNVPMLDLFDENNDPHTHYIALLYKSGMTAEEISACHGIHGFSKQVYCNKVVLKTNFDYIARIVMDMISTIPGKKLFFFATNEAITIFHDWIMYNYSEYINDIGIYTSINPDKESARDKTLILTTSKSAGACLDISNLMVCINMAEPTKSPPQNQQRFGRTRAYNSFYIDIVDTSLKTIMNYYKLSLPMYDKYALDTKRVTFTQNQLKNTAFNVMYKRFKQYGRTPFERIDDNGNTVYW